MRRLRCPRRRNMIDNTMAYSCQNRSNLSFFLSLTIEKQENHRRDVPNESSDNPGTEIPRKPQSNERDSSLRLILVYR
jgi:hypothetical protein